MARLDDIVGYTYRADMYCPDCIVKKMNWTPMEDRASAELALDDMADVAGIDRYNERTFDSDNFPKIIFRDMTSWQNPERCGNCGQILRDVVVQRAAS